MNRRHFLHAAGAALAALSAAPAQAQATASLSGRLLDGRPYELRQDLGKVVLVFFWATSCSVCRDKMPELRANYQAWRDKPFQLLAVSTDKNLAELRGYESILNRVVQPGQRFPWLWRGDAAHRDSFGELSQMPTSFLVDRRGQVAKVYRGRIDPAVWDDIAEMVVS